MLVVQPDYSVYRRAKVRDRPTEVTTPHSPLLRWPDQRAPAGAANTVLGSCASPLIVPIDELRSAWDGGSAWPITRPTLPATGLMVLPSTNRCPCQADHLAHGSTGGVVEAEWWR